jgi:hypothetical protein
MTDNASIRAWYASTQRLLELLDVTLLPPQILYALQSPNPAASKVILANLLGPQLLAFLRKEQIHPFYRLVAQDRLTPGVRFTYQGHFYGKGFGVANRTPLVSLSENVNEILPGKKLLIEFSKSGLITDTAYTRLSGSTNLFAFCSVTEVEDELVRAVPYLIGDLVERTSFGIDLRLADNLSLPVQNIDQFKNVDFQWSPSKTEFNRLRDIPERQVKELFCSLLSEADVPNDWGGEETDVYSSNLTVEGKRCSAAFLLKGPAKFHEMTLADCGKNGDQIYRLFNTPADVFVLQHCHKVTPAVRKTMEAFALSQYSRSCMYAIIDGYDTARILHSHGIL